MDEPGRRWLPEVARLRRVRLDVALLAVEGSVAVVTGVGFLVATLVGSPADRGTAVFLSVLFVLVGLALAAMARASARSRSWPRTPALLTQFFGLVIAWNQRSTLPAVAVVLAVVCLAAGWSVIRASRPG